MLPSAQTFATTDTISLSYDISQFGAGAFFGVTPDIVPFEHIRPYDNISSRLFLKLDAAFGLDIYQPYRQARFSAPPACHGIDRPPNLRR